MNCKHCGEKIRKEIHLNKEYWLHYAGESNDPWKYWMYCANAGPGSVVSSTDSVATPPDSYLIDELLGIVEALS